MPNDPRYAVLTGPQWHIIDALTRETDATTDQIAAHTGMSRGYVNRLLSELRDAGLVARTTTAHPSEPRRRLTWWRINPT
jgi:DNA-binding MarR family transcriptional regulator